MPGKSSRTTTTTPDSDTSTSQGDPLTPVQLRFIEALLVGHNITEAALLVGISRRTATFWLSEPDGLVRKEYERARIAIQGDMQSRVRGLHSLAFQTLEELMKAKSNPAIRFQAAKLLFETHLREISNVQELQSSPTLILTDAAYSFEEQKKQDTTAIYLYDNKGKCRIVD